ncbi:MAG TPA: HetP family heterocyst commitment protein [Coleofasciculaceae cyanobacterium]
MTQQIPYSNPKFQKTISSDQFNKIVEAILDGKYSWACVLMLRFAGHNPLQYIPYRTYNRLLKENSDVDSLHPSKMESVKPPSSSMAAQSGNHAPRKYSSKIVDLGYLEPVSEKSAQISGGSLASFMAQWKSRIEFWKD